VLSLSRVLSVVSLAALIGGPLGLAPALAQTPATISGTVTDPGGAPVRGASVSLRGPTPATTTTDQDGKYSVNAAPGVYTLVVTKGGFLAATADDVALTAGGVTVNVRLTRPTFTSLQTIGSTRVVSGGGGAPAFNTTPASQEIVGQQVFENQGNLQVRDILDETPGIVASISNGSANGGVPGAITFPQIRGGLSYETASLIDGHPVSVGEYGDYVTTFISRFLFQNIELEKGPGAITPLISRAVNGTVNFRTWDPTPTLTANAEFGVDAWGGKWQNMRIADTVANGKLGFVLDYGTWGTPGPAGNDDPQGFMLYDPEVTFTDSHGNTVTPAPTSPLKGSAVGATNSAVGYSGASLACCVNMNTYFESRGFLGKLRYNFSNSTTLTLTEISTQTLSSQNGNTSGLYAFNFNPTVPNLLPPGMREEFDPYSDNFAQDYEINNEPILEGELRTSLNNDNVLFRVYHAAISRLQTNGDPGGSPITMPVDLYGQTTGGQPLNGVDPFGNPYVATFTDTSYQSNEIDSLTGYSFEYDHVFGNSGNVLTFSADQNYSETHVYEPGLSDVDYAPTDDIPSGSAQNTATYLLRGIVQVTPKLSATVGYYLTRLSSNFGTWYPFNKISNTPYYIGFTDEVNWHQDERAALAYRLDHNTSLRAAAGSGFVPAYLGILNGAGPAAAPEACGNAAHGNPLCPGGFATGYENTFGGGLNIRPETSFGYDLGADHRLTSDGLTVLSGDIYMTNLHDQFLKSTFTNGFYTGAEGTLQLLTNAYSNLADARYEGIELKINHAPRVGVGYIVQGSLTHDYPYDISKTAAATNPGLVAGVNFGPDTLLSNTRMPYSQGYGEVNYQTNGFYANVGALYLGSNNSYNEPGFGVFRTTVRVPLFHGSDVDVHGNTYIQGTVDNIFNVHPEIFDLDYQGVGYPANNGLYFATSLKGYGPRTFRLQVSHDFK
jgi:hypothetical protein